MHAIISVTFLTALASAATLRASPRAAQDVRGCGGSGTGSYTSADVMANLGDFSLDAKSVKIFREGTAQICVVNRAPNTKVDIKALDVNGQISQIQSTCCKDQQSCEGGASTFVANMAGNQIDVAVQTFGSDCAARST